MPTPDAPLYQQMKNIKDKVEYWLKRDIKFRDNDNVLIATFWFHELGGKNTVQNLSAKDLLDRFAHSELTSPESIRRVRQKLQEDNASLRGTEYGRRKDEGDDTTNKIAREGIPPAPKPLNS